MPPRSRPRRVGTPGRFGSFAKEKARVFVIHRNEDGAVGKGLLLWLVGIPLPIILLLWLLGILS